MEGGLAYNGLVTAPTTKRELSEKELEAAPALLMLLSRTGDAPRPVENGMRINHLDERSPAERGNEAPSIEEVRRGYRTADTSSSSPATFASQPHVSPPQPTTSEYQAPRARVSIYSLLNDDDDDEMHPHRSQAFGASTLAASSSSRSTPTSPVSSSLPPLESLLSAGRAGGSPPMPRTSSDLEVRTSGIRTRSRSAGGRKLLSSSSPAMAQKPVGGRKRKAAANKGAASTATTPATTKNDRRTKKQRQLELLQSVNSGRSLGAAGDLVGTEDIVATLASSSPLLAFSSASSSSSSSFLPSVLTAARRDRARAHARSDDASEVRQAMEVGDDTTATTPSTGTGSGGMLPPAPLASYLSAMSSPLPAGAASPLPLPSSLAQLQQLLPSPLPTGVDQQRVMQLKSQLIPPQQPAPSSPGGRDQTNATVPAGGSGASSPGPANVHSMANYLNLNLNINAHHASRFGDKKRERRDSFSFTYPNRNGDQHHHHHQAAAASAPAPLPQHQQEFLQQLLQQIHKKQTTTTTTTATAIPAAEAAASPALHNSDATATSPVPVDAPTSPSLFRFYQRPPPHRILPAASASLVGGDRQLPSSFSAEADPSLACAVVDHAPAEDVIAPRPEMSDAPLLEAETEASGATVEGQVEAQADLGSEPMDVAKTEGDANDYGYDQQPGDVGGDDVDSSSSSSNSSQEAPASGVEEGVASETQRMDEESERERPVEASEYGPQEGRTGSIESHQPADQQQQQQDDSGNGGGSVEGESDYSPMTGMETGDDVFAGRRKKASPQQMAILEQIWSSAGFRGALRASTTLDFTSSFPSLSSSSASWARGRSSPASVSAKSSPQLSSSSSSSSLASSPAAVADALLSSSRRSPVRLAASPSPSPTLSFAISSPNLPSFFASSSYAHLKKAERHHHVVSAAAAAAVNAETNDDEQDDEHDASGLTIVGDEEDDEEPNAREVESLVIASVPSATLPHYQRSAILLPFPSSLSSSSSSSSSTASTYDRATMERSQPGGPSTSSSSSSSSSSSAAEASAGQVDGDQRRAATARQGASDAAGYVGAGMEFSTHGSCENGSVGA